MTNQFLKGAEGLAALFIVLAVLALFLITTTDEEIARIYIFFILFALVFVVASLLSTGKASSLLPSFGRTGPFLVAPLLAHIVNNAVVVSTVQLGLDIIYPLILVGIFIFLFYKIFKNTMKKPLLITSIGVGLGFGLLLSSQSVVGSLGVPVLYSLESAAYSVFLLGIMAAITEEIVFRGILFPFFFRSTVHEEAFSALLLSSGAIIAFMSDFQYIGWLLITLGIIEFINKKKQIIAKSKIIRGITSAIAASAIFAAFHVKVMQDPNMLISAFAFGMITCGMVYWSSRGNL